MTLPWFLWAAGAQAVGHYNGADKVRCSECHRWTRDPAWYGPPNIGPAAVAELDRVLCARCHGPRVDAARAWATSLNGDPST